MLMKGERFYRRWVEASDLISFEVREGETDLMILAEKKLIGEAKDSIIKHRSYIEEYIIRRPEFATSLEPLKTDEVAPEIIKDMMEAAVTCGVGPMASVAGAVAEYVGRDLLKLSGQIIVENGGDIFFKTSKERILGIFAGDSKFTRKLGLRLGGEKRPLGICTSSGSVGHSLSFGGADAVVVISEDSMLSDAAATRIGNIVKDEGDIEKGMGFAKSLDRILGVVIIVGDKLGTWGKLELVSI
jgi:hypothetical protein